MNGLTALGVGHLGDAARVDDTDVGRLTRPHRHNAGLTELTPEGARLGEI